MYLVSTAILFLPDVIASSDLGRLDVWDVACQEASRRRARELLQATTALDGFSNEMGDGKSRKSCKQLEGVKT